MCISTIVLVVTGRFTAAAPLPWPWGEEVGQTVAAGSREPAGGEGRGFDSRNHRRDFVLALEFPEQGCRLARRKLVGAIGRSRWAAPFGCERVEEGRYTYPVGVQ